MAKLHYETGPHNQFYIQGLSEAGVKLPTYDGYVIYETFSHL